MRALVLTFLAMVISGGATRFCNFAAIPAILLSFLGCGDRHLTAILAAPAGTTVTPPDAGSDGGTVSCAPAASRPLPPLGWDGWNEFRCRPELNQEKFQANVDALLARGMKDAGYEFANLDDCWQAQRGTDGTLSANARFPDGMAALGRYVHDRGLKFGIYAITTDCKRMELTTPGSMSHEVQDATSFAAWGVDYVKYARCGGDIADAPAAFSAMRDALAQAGRAMHFAMVAPPFSYWQMGAGDQWRTHGDVEPGWPVLLDIIDAHSALAAYSGQVGFNDADMLWVGNTALTEAESRAHFSMWAMFSSPLLAGNDLSTMTDATAAILTNREVIALDQDPLALQGVLLDQQGDVGVYGKPLSACGARAVVLLNRGTQAADATVTWQELGLAAGVATVRDLWAGRDLAPVHDTLTLSVAPHDVRALRIVGSEPPLPRGTPYLSDLPWTYAANGWGPVERDQELGGKAAGDGQALSLGGTRYAKGLGTNSPALIRYLLGKRCSRFSAEIGIDDLAGRSGSAVFQVWGDTGKIFDSGTMLRATPPRHIDLDVSGVTELRLFVGEVEDVGQDHADWADARLSCEP
ncbi:MAG: NPCBM/NEW2 domain-containing protein [Pseudomonadota bacterium]